MGRSVVQVLVYSQTPIWDAPWRNNPVAGSSGTGFVIDGERVMTNAHVVSWAKQIVLRRFQDPRPWIARVEYISHECDLAVLKVETPGFFDGLKPLPLGGLPKVQSTVVTCGYPAGGKQQGRKEYSHAGKLLANPQRVKGKEKRPAETGRL